MLEKDSHNKTVEFQRQQYYDDRLFVLYLCTGKVEIEDDDNGATWTTIYHENPPKIISGVL